MRVKEFYRWDAARLELLREFADGNEYFERVNRFVLSMEERQIIDLSLRQERFLQEALAAFEKEKARREALAAEEKKRKAEASGGEQKPIRLG